MQAMIEIVDCTFRRFGHDHIVVYGEWPFYIRPDRVEQNEKITSFFTSTVANQQKAQSLEEETEMSSLNTTKIMVTETTQNQKAIMLPAVTAYFKSMKRNSILCTILCVHKITRLLMGVVLGLGFTLLNEA